MKMWAPMLGGFKPLTRLANALGDLLNARTPIKGDGISISETPGGYFISLETIASTVAAATPSSKSGGQTPEQLWSVYKDLIYSIAHPPNPMPAAGTFTPWLSNSDLGWMAVGVVDATTCKKSTICVWAFSPGAGRGGGGGL